jgi:hypothetical protein
VSLPQRKPSEARIASGEEEPRPRPAIRRVPREDLPGIQPLLFRELDHRIAQTRLGYEPLPEGFLTTETEADGSALVFRGELYDLNITLFTAEQRPAGPTRGSGVFVVSTGAGVATNTVDQLSRSIPVAGMIDLKRNPRQRSLPLEMSPSVPTCTPWRST